MHPTFTIAIDGPAGAGKGTLARGWPTIITSTISTPASTYRAVAHALLSHGLPLDNVSAAETAARQVDLTKLDRGAAVGACGRRGGLEGGGHPGGAARAGRKAARLRQDSRRARCSTAATSARWCAPTPT